jgi:hypothetical protein
MKSPLEAKKIAPKLIALHNNPFWTATTTNVASLIVDRANVAPLLILIMDCGQKRFHISLTSYFTLVTSRVTTF